MKVRCNGNTACGSQREKKNRCVQVRKCLIDGKRAEQGNKSLLGSQFVYIGVLSDDFATVDLREVLCYHSRPEKRKFRGTYISIRVQKV